MRMPSPLHRRAMMRTLSLLLVLLAISSESYAQTRARQTASRSSDRSLAIRAEMANVMLQNRQYADAVREFNLLVALEPKSVQYRLGLARAFAWGGRPRDAERELTILSQMRPGDPEIAKMLVSARAAVRPDTRQATAWFISSGRSPEYRRILARSLVADGRTAEALAHYDTLLHARPNAEILVERAYAHLESGDQSRALTDAVSSIGTQPTRGGYVLLGDLYRWRGDYAEARSHYERAARFAGDTAEIDAVFARLARDERPALGYMPELYDAPGWRTFVSATSDNLGARYSTYGARRGIADFRGFDVSAGARGATFTQARTSLPDDSVEPFGAGADVAVSRGYEQGRVLLRGRGRAGFIMHPGGDLIPDASIAAGLWMNAWAIGAELLTAPAYPAMLTLGSFLPVNGEQLTERTTAFTLAGPISSVDVALTNRYSTLSDGNRRTLLQGLARRPMTDRVSLLYAGSSLGFSRPSGVYWDPARYVSHSVGAEYALRRPLGLSFAVRALPGAAWSTSHEVAGQSESLSAFQFTGGADVAYRTLRWEAGSSASFGRGRAGSYERFDIAIYARLAR